MLCTIFFSKVISAIESIKFCDDGKVFFSSSSLDCNNIGFVRSLIVELCDVNSLMAKFSSFSHQLNFSRTFLMKWINYDKIETFFRFSSPLNCLFKFTFNVLCFFYHRNLFATLFLSILVRIQMGCCEYPILVYQVSCSLAFFLLLFVLLCFRFIWNHTKKLKLLCIQHKFPK